MGISKNAYGLIRFSLTGQIKRNEMGEFVACMRERRGAYRVLVKRHDGKKTLGIVRRGWEDSIKMYLQAVG